MCEENITNNVGVSEHYIQNILVISKIISRINIEASLNNVETLPNLHKSM